MDILGYVWIARISFRPLGKLIGICSLFRYPRNYPYISDISCTYPHSISKDICSIYPQRHPWCYPFISLLIQGIQCYPSVSIKISNSDICDVIHWYPLKISKDIQTPYPYVSKELSMYIYTYPLSWSKKSTFIPSYPCRNPNRYPFGYPCWCLGASFRQFFVYLSSLISSEQGLHASRPVLAP